MYAVAARIQGADVVTVPLRADRNFALDEQAVLERWTPEVKVVFLCSPNNPTANLLDEQAMLRLAHGLRDRAMLVVDEAYIEFSAARSLARHIRDLPHLAILRTLSKAYALAGARCGALIADAQVVALLRKIIAPYAITQLTMEAVLKVLEPGQLAISRTHLDMIVSERERLMRTLAAHPGVSHVWPSDANFVLARFTDAATALSRSRGARLLIRDVRGYPGLDDCLRISVGSVEQNDRLLDALR
jgi:histidinol-phosphate aminotransferase